MAQVLLEVWECVKGGDGGTSQWQSRDYNLDTISTALDSDSRCFLVFLDTPATGSPSQSSLHTTLSTKFDISSAFWSELCQKANGYFRCRSVPATGQRHSNITCTELRALCKHDKPAVQPSDTELEYLWYKLGFASRWAEHGSSVLFCFDLEPKYRTLLQQVAANRLSFEAAVGSAYAFHAVVLDVITQVFDDAVWAWRNHVRITEKFRLKEKSEKSQKSDYVFMHDLVRHVAHLSESLTTTLNVVAELIEANDQYHKLIDKPNVHHGDFAYNRSMLNCLLERSRALEKRLQGEINLVFHMNALTEALSAADIARAAKKDSTTMKTVSILGLVFLPGTLISAIFSTSFFDYSPDTDAGAWSVSSQFWIFWAFAIPITMLTLASWSFWQWWQDDTPLADADSAQRLSMGERISRIVHKLF